MDYTHIFNSDFFTSTIIDIMSPIELHRYKNTTKYINKKITIDTIYNKIILCVQNKLKNNLKNNLKDKYDEFIDMVTRRNMEFYGPFITKVINGDELGNTYINMRMTDDHMGTLLDNVFNDYKKIDSHCTFDPVQKFNSFEGWFHHESDRTIFLNKSKTIKLHIFSIGHEDTIPETYPTIFQNSVKIIKDNNKYKWILTIGHIGMVMDKTQLINFSKEKYYCRTGNIYAETKQLCDKNNIQYKFENFGDYNMDCRGRTASIIVYDTNNNKFTMFGQSLYSNQNDRISCNPIELTNNSKCTQIYIDIKLQEFNYECNHVNCPFKTFPFNHFHSCIFLKNGDNKMVACAIIFKYDNIPIFANHTKIFDIIDTNIINNTIIKKLDIWHFPPLPISKKYTCTNINDYKKMFNNNFDVGEFAYIEQVNETETGSDDDNKMINGW